MQFSLGAPLRPAPQAHAAPKQASYGPAARGPLSFGRFARVTQGHVDPNWLSLLHEWWDRHGYYPEQAVANREDGTVGITIVVDRYGHVHRVTRERRSGSVWLDMAAEATFRDASLPPFPPDTSDDQITVDLTITYMLVRR
jgi:TonB family protein